MSEQPAYRTRCLSCGEGREGHDAQGKCITVSGRSMKVTRLDPEGQPMGDPVVIEAAATLGFEAQFPETEIESVWVQDPVFPVTIDFTLQQVDPELLTLLMGTSKQPTFAFEAHYPVKRTFWQWLRRKPRLWNHIYIPHAQMGEVDSDD